MKKLQSLEKFKSLGLHKHSLSSIVGGFQEALQTGAGTVCVNEAISSTGCASYTSDTISDGGTTVVYHEYKDVDLPC